MKEKQKLKEKDMYPLQDYFNPQLPSKEITEIHTSTK